MMKIHTVEQVRPSVFKHFLIGLWIIVCRNFATQNTSHSASARDVICSGLAIH